MTHRNRRLFWVAFGVLVLANAFFFARVYVNRSGQPESSVLLTEREMPIVSYSSLREDSSTQMRITWRLACSGKDEGWMSPAFLDRQKLLEVGFSEKYLTLDEKNRTLKKPAHSKNIVLVLEFDGEAYQQFVQQTEKKLDEAREKCRLSPDDIPLKKQLESAEKEVQNAKTTATRLFAIDAGQSREQLRARYPDRAKYILVEALVRPVLRGRDGNLTLGGQIEQIGVDTLYLPVGLQHLVEDAKKEPLSHSKGTKPRYIVKLIHGRLLEPWIAEIQIPPSPSMEQ